MLKSLSITNYAILEQVDINFVDKLNIITGETGAGKSILLGALGLIMGQRVDTKVLFDKEKKCIVEANFSGYDQAVDDFLDQNALDKFDELLIRREIIPSGRSRAFINDTPTNIDVLQQLSLLLVDLNQQFQILDIQDKGFQLRMVDAMAGHQEEVDKFSNEYREYKSTEKRLLDLENTSSVQLKEMDFLNFQSKELEDAAIQPGEIEALENELVMYEKTEEIAQLINETKFSLSESDTSVVNLVQDLIGKWESFTKVNNNCTEILEKLNLTSELLTEVYGLSETLENQLEHNPLKTQELKGRLDVLFSLQRKHGAQSTQQLLEIMADLSEKIKKYNGKDEEISRLKGELKKSENRLSSLAKKISAKRKKIITPFEKEVNKKLVALAMPSAEVKIQHELQKEGFNSKGSDQIDFLFKANKGSEFQKIKKVASGGETSRLMLAIKTTVADKMALPTMIFDEIDTGVSGEVAMKMGKTLKALADKHQVICVTHSPQVSAMATQHYFVSKEQNKKRTTTKVTALTIEERIVEIAKMLSGNPPSSFALENAKDLIQLNEAN